MEKQILSLFQLQQIDTELQQIHELKGDLPDIVQDLSDRIAATKTTIKNLNDLLKTTKKERDNADAEIIKLHENIERLKSQQLQVKSNKQYDALAREIDYATENIAHLEKIMETCEGTMQVAKTDLDSASAGLEEINIEFEERQKELKEVNKEHEKEEMKFFRLREDLLGNIEKTILERYERIRKAKSGTAVVPIRRGACGGCFNRIPPQKILELRVNSKYYVCEHCGRIVVSDEVVEKSSVAG